MKQPSKEYDYNCDADAHTLMEAASIRMDPERMAEALKVLKKKKQAAGGAIESLDDLRARKAQLDEEEDEADED